METIGLHVEDVLGLAMRMEDLVVVLREAIALEKETIVFYTGPPMDLWVSFSTPPSHRYSAPP